jgi:hypothetical protein
MMVRPAQGRTSRFDCEGPVSADFVEKLRSGFAVEILIRQRPDYGKK